MTNEQFLREKLYQATLSISKTMHSKGIITSEELLSIDKILLQKYRPLLGSLYFENKAKNLQCSLS